MKKEAFFFFMVLLFSFGLVNDFRSNFPNLAAMNLSQPSFLVESNKKRSSCDELVFIQTCDSNCENVKAGIPV